MIGKMIYSRRKTMYQIMKKSTGRQDLSDGCACTACGKSLSAGSVYYREMDEKGERIPLTICDYDREAGTITIVVQEVGASTTKMSSLKRGITSVISQDPLGCPSEFVHEDMETLKKKNPFCGRRCGRGARISAGKMAL